MYYSLSGMSRYAGGETRETAGCVWAGALQRLFKKYNLKGSYTIKVKAIDTLGAESDWATIKLRVPYSNNYPAWQWLCERFPMLARILNPLNLNV